MIVHMKAGLNVKDLSGQESKSQFWYWPAAWTAAFPDTALADTLTMLKAYATLFADTSEGAGQEVMASEVRGFNDAAAWPSVVGEPYYLGFNKAVFDLQRDDSGRSLLKVPAPKLAIFVEGSDRIDTAHADVAALAAALTSGNVSTSSGIPYKLLLTGYRTGKKNRGKAPGGF